MTGVDKDLATLRDWIGDPEDYSDEDRGAAERACDACDGVEAELSRLREERDAALRESDWEKGQRLAAQVTLKAITDSLCLPLAELGDGWTDSTPKILARIEEIVDEGERGFRERDAAEARCARLQQEYDEARAIITEQHSKLWMVGLDNHEGEPPQSREYSHTQLDRLLDEALAGPDAQTSGSGSSAADPSVGERQGRQPDPGDIAGLLVELSRWSRVAELNGDLHARIASALAGPDTPAQEGA